MTMKSYSVSMVSAIASKSLAAATSQPCSIYSITNKKRSQSSFWIGLDSRSIRSSYSRSCQPTSTIFGCIQSQCSSAFPASRGRVPRLPATSRATLTTRSGTKIRIQLLRLGFIIRHASHGEQHCMSGRAWSRDSLMSSATTSRRVGLCASTSPITQTGMAPAPVTMPDSCIAHRTGNEQQDG